MEEQIQEQFEIKPEINISKDKFKRQADDYLSKLEDYKKMDKLMKQYESNIKSYMVKNELETYTNQLGRITIDYVKVNCLNRALIEDITQYYEETSRIMMRKSLNSAKPKIIN